jgi:DNA-binding MarR family transcriptional regulator
MTDTHMRLLAWLADHEGASLTSAAAALGLPLADVERLARELADAGLIERTALH